MYFLLDGLAALLRLALRLVFVVAGLVFALSLLAALLVVAGLWLLRSAWARITGRPAAPWVLRVDPRAGWGRVYRAGERAAQAAPVRRRPSADGVTDVEAKRPVVHGE